MPFNERRGVITVKVRDEIGKNHLDRYNDGTAVGLLRSQPMTQFFFHVRDGEDYLQDEEGVDLPDLDTAQHEAVLAAREMISEMVLKGQIIDGQTFEIADADGRILTVVSFKSAIRLE